MPVTATDPADGSRLALAVGDSALIRLSTPGVTGHRWVIVELPDTVRLESEWTDPPTAGGVGGGEQRLPGQSGTTLFEVLAVEPGTGRLAFALQRPWESEPERTLTLEFSAD